MRWSEFMNEFIDLVIKISPALIGFSITWFVAYFCGYLSGRQYQNHQWKKMQLDALNAQRQAKPLPYFEELLKSEMRNKPTIGTPTPQTISTSPKV